LEAGRAARGTRPARTTSGEPRARIVCEWTGDGARSTGSAWAPDDTRDPIEETPARTEPGDRALEQHVGGDPSKRIVKHTGTGCYLEVVMNERRLFTTALGPGLRPAAPLPDLAFTAMSRSPASSTGRASTSRRRPCATSPGRTRPSSTVMSPRQSPTSRLAPAPAEPCRSGIIHDLTDRICGERMAACRCRACRRMPCLHPGQAQLGSVFDLAAA
jgi:hypothetical protein